MNLRQLEVFLSVVEQGSFSAAAQESMLTQSTVSQHIAGLEADLGVRVLERGRSGIRVTEAGKILLEHARRVVAEVRATEEALQRHRGIESPTLRIGASTVPGAYLVPPILAVLCDRFPRLETILVQGGSSETADRIASQEVEAGVVGSRFEERGFTYAPVGRDRISLIAPREHPWAARGSVRPNDLYEAPFVMREPGSGTWKTAADALAKIGVDAGRFSSRARVGGSETVKAAVLASVGIAFLSEIVARRELDRGDLVVLPVEGLSITRTFYLARRAGRELSRGAAAFWELMLTTYGDAKAP